MPAGPLRRRTASARSDSEGGSEVCAIAGVWGRNDRALVRRMLGKMAHRGPDGSGLFDGAGVTLGHRRLSIIDLETGGQPMESADSEHVIAFNGEIYNYRELRPRLTGHEFASRSDTEVLLHGLEEWGPRFLPMCRGMFAFALVGPDGLLLARDPLGVKPLYYATEGGAFAFASEIKGLLPFSSQVREFPNASYLHLPRGAPPRRRPLPFRRFYRLPRAAGEKRPARSAAAGVERRLTTAVRRRLVADVPVASFLSGGLDSSFVSALASAEHPRIETFSCGMEGSEDERFARMAAEHLGTHHRHREYAEDEVIARLPEVIRFLESFDPALVRSAVPNFFVSEASAPRAKVVLTGEGADELFAGYDYLRALPRRRLHGELVRITAELHNRNLQRGDRMTMANSQEGRVPFLDVDLVDFALPLPDDLKLPRGAGAPSKWVLRKVASRWLPKAVVERPKLKFSAGAGSSDVLARHAERSIGNRAFARAVARARVPLRSKEELLYYRLFQREFGSLAPEGLIGITEDYGTRARGSAA